MAIQQMFLGAGGKSTIPIDEIFSVDEYPSYGVSKSINNGIDLLGEGGMVWFKSTDQTTDHAAFDTERGINIYSSSNRVDNEVNSLASIGYTSLSAFNNNGFSLGAPGSLTIANTQGYNYVSWTFRKAEKFFDVVSWTGTSATTKEINHSLGCAPGMIIYKARNNVAGWYVWHKSLNVNQYLQLNGTNAAYTETSSLEAAYPFGKDAAQAPTDSKFNVGNWYGGGSTTNYIGYVFAEDEDNIKCGVTIRSASGTNTMNTVELGWEPQWIMLKTTDSVGGWQIMDTTRGITTSGSDSILEAQISAGAGSSNFVEVYSTGFKFRTGYVGANVELAYVAIRKEE